MARITTSQKIVLALLFICVLSGAATGGKYYYHFAYFLGGLYLLSWIQSLLALRGIAVIRVARSYRSQVGQIFEERFEITNHSRLPHLWILIQDKSPLPGNKGSRVISLIKGKESRSFLVRTRLVKRGLFPLGDTVISSGDFFGLFPVSKTVKAHHTLLVYPMTLNLRYFPHPSGWITGGEAIRRRTQQITPNAVGVRDYVPGDPMNRIHWLSTARKDRLIVKEFELDPLAEIWLFFDANREFHYGDASHIDEINQREYWKPFIEIPIPQSSFEYQVVISASLARYFLKIGRAVGFVSQGRALHVLPAERGSRQFGKVMESLAILEPEGRLPIYSLVESQAKLMPRGSTVILLSPSSDDALVRSIIYLERGGYRPVVIYIDASTFSDMAGSANEIIEKLQTFNIPMYVIRNGDDLAMILSQELQLQGKKAELF